MSCLFSLNIHYQSISYTTQILKRWGRRDRHNKHTLGYNLVLMAKHCFWTISNLINGSSVCEMIFVSHCDDNYYLHCI